MRMVNSCLMACALLLPATLAAQEKKDDTLSEAGRIASRPAQDVGIAKSKVPLVLRRAAAAPYSRKGTGTCAQLTGGIRALDGALGPDFDDRSPVSENKAGKIAKVAGEALVDSIIPFRGLVREVSGAAGAQRRLQAATYAGLARRGFLRGLYQSRGCRTGL